MDFAAGWMTRWPLATQFRLGFAAALALVLGVAGAAGWIALDHQNEIKQAYETQLRSTMQLTEAQTSFWQLRFGMRQYMFQALDYQAFLQEQDAWHARIEERLAEYARTTESVDERRALTSLRSSYLRYKQARPKFFELWRAGRKDEAMVWMALTTDPFAMQTGRAFDAQIELQRASSEQARSASEHKATLVLAGVGAMTLALLAMLGFGYAYSARLLRPIRALEARMRHTVREEIGEAVGPAPSANEVKALVDGFQWMTERLHAHSESLRQSRERLDFLLAATPAVIWSSRASGDFGATFVSANVRAQLGYDPEDFTADPGFWAGRIHPDDRERVFAGLAVIEKEDSHVHEYRFRHKDGSWRWMHDELKVIRDAHGVAKELIGYWIDVTARVRADQERAQALERLQSAMEGAQLVVWDADETGKIWMSREWAELLGEPGGTTRMTFNELVALAEPQDRERLRNVIVAVVKGERAEFSEEYPVRGATGKSRWLQVQGRVTQRTAAGRAARMGGTARDITARKQAEEQQQMVADRLALANSVKTDFMANVTHELRTPLNSVIGFAELLKDEVPGPLNEQQAAFTADILAGGRELLRLVEGILEMSRLGEVPTAASREPVEIGALLQDCVAAQRQAAGASRIGITLEVEPGAGRALMDPVTLRRMLDALLDNAIKFNRTGGQVTVSARRQGAWLEIAVADTGIGIAPEDLGAVFQPFGQVDTHLARLHGGLGLGLALARSLAQAQGGTIDVASELGHGSTFTLRLPAGETP